MAAKFFDESSIPDVIAELTLREKALLTNGQTRFGSAGIERLNIPAAMFIDGAPGINFNQLFHEFILRERISSGVTDTGEYVATEGLVEMLRKNGVIDEPSLNDAEKRAWSIIKRRINECCKNGDSAPSAFPVGMMLGATWSPETIYAVGEAAGREFDGYNIDIMLGPNINIHRDPLNGRLFEGYSEDPRLIEELAPAFIKGVQSTGIAAEVKHFAANNQEWSRMNGDEIIPMRALREIYLPGFRACLTNGGAKTVMSAYNKINGTACALNKWLLTDVLRNEWGFDGMVVSDWGAVYNQIEAIKAGNDLEMPHNASVDDIVNAVESGILDEKLLDRAIERLLKCLLKLPVMAGHKYSGIDSAHSRAAAYAAACEGIVLLKNDGVLPLQKDGIVSFIGEKSLRFTECGEGSAEVISTRTSSLFECAREKLGDGNAVYSYVHESACAVVITVGAIGQEGKDRPNMELEPSDKQMLLSAIAEAKRVGARVIVILNIAAPVDMRDFINDCDAILCAFLPGCEGARAACDILFGDVNPSGKLPLTFPVKYKDCPSYLNFPGYGGEVWYSEGIYVGYRWYEAREIKPAFAFGHGLSYTEFKLSGLHAIDDILDTAIDKPARFTVNVKNVGTRDGKEVVQLYIAQPDSTLPKPVKELKAFNKVSLRPNEETTIEFVVHKADIESFDNKRNAYTVETGKYVALVGNASDNISCEVEFTVVGKNPYGFNPNRPIGKTFNDSRCVDAFNSVFEGIAKASMFNMRMEVTPEWELCELFDYYQKHLPEEKISEFYSRIDAFNY